MFTRRVLFRLATIYLYYGARACGILPFCFDGNRFHSCEFHLLWSLCAATSTIVTVGFSFYRIVTLLPYPTLDIVRQLIYCKFIIRLGIIASCYALALIYNRQFLAHSNAILRNLQRLECFEVLPEIDKKLVLYGLGKVCIVNIMMSVLFAINFRFNMENDPVPLFERIMNIYAVFVVAQVSNVCLFSLYIGAHLYRSVNSQVKKIIRDICFSTEVCENLTALSRIHYSTSYSVQGICRIFSIPLGLINLNQLVVFIVCFFISRYCLQMYFVYVSTSQQLRHEFTITLNRYFNSFLYLAFELIHLVCLVSASALSARRAEKTLLYLNEFFETEVAPRIDENIQTFTIGLLLRDQSVSPCGLYRLDFALFFSIFAAITNKLIVLVQLQLGYSMHDSNNTTRYKKKS
ncbi:uncharacterized protein LOC129729261 [Wyeomyia smithii]|uniref:uncharacterized protein LOC129729261 n=1 Tax=Wyeomyia smithii TaxID=174621 RepID=UPI0024681E10|nr:uncharacterized protein LOC129729261 [Wyeomyia smithii]